MSSTVSDDQRRTLSSSTPGGSACRFRVQQRTPAGDWHLCGSFDSRLAAQLCLADLRARGFEGRLVAIRIRPVAA